MARPKAKAKRLGAALRQGREGVGMTLVQAAEAIGWDKNRLWRVEQGQGPYRRDDVLSLLGLYQVTGDRRERLLSMVGTLNEPGWWEGRLIGLPKEQGTLMDYEADAQQITHWAPLLAPGMLQTMEYARSWMLFDGISEGDTEVRLAVRVRRQQVLTRDVRYTAYLGEPALRTPVGGHRVLAAQLDALIAATERENVSVRVVPMTIGPHRGQLGAFGVLEYDEWEPVVHLENLRSVVYLEDIDVTAPYLDAIGHLYSIALSETASLSLIRKIRRDAEERDE